MALVDSNANHVQHILANLDFLVVQDMFLSKQLVLLMLFTSSTKLRKEGTFTNTERRIQRLYEVLKPLGDSKPDWWILQKLLVHSAGLELRKSK